MFEPEIDDTIESTTYDDIMKEVEEEEKKQTNSNIMFGEVTLDDITALEIEYDTNYIKKELIKIAEYYEISIRKKKQTRLKI